MSDRKSSSWLYPASTGDPGRDRNARTLQFTCVLFAFASVMLSVFNAIGQDWTEFPILGMSGAGLVAASIMNRAGMWKGAARAAILTILLTAVLLVFLARDGFRSHAMILFPGLLLISVMLLDRASYIATASIVLFSVAILGIAEIHGLTRVTPPLRTPTGYGSIFLVDFTLFVFAAVGSRIARDTQRNIFDLRTTIARLSAANLESVQIREHLQESEQRLKNAERLAHVGHWYRDLKSGQVIWSEECSRIFGLPRGYVPGKEELLRMVVPQDRELIRELIARHGLTAKSGNSIEYQIARSDGELRALTAIFEVLLDEEGSPARVFGAVRDITDERRAQEETAARQKLESVGTLANGIAHDFNNLLGGVLAQAELALSELAAGGNPEGELRAIRDVAIRGSEIVRELMIYAGKETAALGLVDVSRIIEEMLELLTVSVSKHAVLETNLGQGCPGVLANAAQLRQIVMNLVTNASDALGDRDGVIRVATTCVKAGQKPSGEIPGRVPDGDYLELEVSDTGCGIAQETQAKVFDPFFTTKAAGHGLGLAIVQGIVRSLGGAIHIVSEPGKGATFQVLLPCAEVMGEGSPSPNPPAESTLVNYAATALVVEDEDTLRTAAANMLRKSGLSVLEAADGNAALAAIRGDSPIDVLLLDVTLPGVPGQEILREARRLRPTMRVIVTSAYGEDFAATSLQADVARFLRKPYTLRDLVGLVRQALL
jgi:PAS domain S-box-containing protein